MKYIKLFEDYNKVSIDDIVACTKAGGTIETNIVKGMLDNPKEVKPISVDDDGNITVKIDNEMYEVDIKNVDRVNYQLNENYDPYHYIKTIKRLVLSGDESNIDIAFETSKGLNIDIEKIMYDIFGKYFLERYAVGKTLKDKVWYLTNTKIFRLGDKDLDEVPIHLCSFTWVNELHLNSNKLTTLPDEFENLTNLQYLDLKNNNISEFPEVILKLPKLKKLFISQNPIYNNKKFRYEMCQWSDDKFCLILPRENLGDIEVI